MKHIKRTNALHALLLVTVLAIVSFFSASVMADPSGGTITPGTPETAPADAAGSASAFAGNITSLTITGFSTTQSWQGYHGNVTGTIQLANANDDVLYNWSLASPEGEIYASTNSTITWGSIQCFNFTANGTEPGAGPETAGGTSLAGLNTTGLESRFNINSSDVDGVDETFGFTITHNEFFTANLQFSAGECPATAAFDNTNSSVDGNFEEALLYEPATRSVVFASLLEQDTLGFDQDSHDFEMLVLEDGHSGDVAATTYFMFVELE